MKTFVTEKAQNGVLALTFDDSRYADWLDTREIFRQYKAHATFFYSGILTPDHLRSMKLLQAEGHSIGLHTLHHKDCTFTEKADLELYCKEEILPHLEILQREGISVQNFAYPNNRHSEETDQLLAPYFRRFRAGLSPSPGKGYWIADQDHAYLDAENLPISLGGNGIGEYYATTVENLDAALERAAAEDKLIVFFSHGISENAQHVHMKTAWLERMLKKANDLGMEIIGFDEL